MTRRLLALAAALALTAPVHAQPAPAGGPARGERYSEVLLYVPADGDPGSPPGQALAARLGPRGVVLDHPRREVTARGPAFRAVLSARELAAARASGVEVEVLVEDLTAHYLATRQGTCEAGMGVSRIEANLCGTQGGYPSYSAVVAHLDTLRARYPAIVSERVSLGQGHEGRDLWMVEISDDPGVDEGEPEALYTAMHHAREPGSMMAVLYFMYYLGERYGTDPDVTALVNGRRLFFVPVLNPDGYVYNETTDPGGGGLWRKNRRDNGGGEFGVDLNRNYGYQWGYDDNGSSPFTWSGTYRGPAPFSEPEVQAVRDFVEGRRIAAAFNYHTFGDLLLYSWTYAHGAYTPDDALFEALGDTLTAYNGYTYGTSPDVLYPVNGGSDDWMYGEQATKPKVFSFTPEVGYDFWPDPIDVYRLADENLEANLLLAELAGELTPVAAEPPAPLPSGLALDVVGPNPVRTGAEVAFTLAAPSAVRLAVYDVLGREVAVLVEGERTAGRHPARFDASGLAPGAYVLRLTAGGEGLARILTVVR
jgi:hypothetical protein